MDQASVSKSEIDRLGDRLRETVSPDDLRMLDGYRLSFADAYDEVANTVRERTGVDVSGRPAKSTTAIVEKLKRESIRLSQMQDIAGCRIVVGDIAQQNTVTNELLGLFPDSEISDRRETPSHGYRAVHIIVPAANHKVEVQIRTQLQHLWAELSEKLADKFGIAVKYGGGTDAIRQRLGLLSENIDLLELLDRTVGSDPRKKKHIDGGKMFLRETLTELLNSAESDE